MRRILVDNARAKLTQKRGGAIQRQPLEDVAERLPDEELLSLHEALERLQQVDDLKAQLVELRYFVGLTGDQAAEVLGISPSTADRHWAFARAWLIQRMQSQQWVVRKRCLLTSHFAQIRSVPMFTASDSL